MPDLVKETGAVLLTGLLILSMCRTQVPNEWIWLRDRAAQLTGIAVTARGLGFTAAAGAAVLWLGSGLFAVGPGEVGMRLRLAGSWHRISSLACTSGGRGRSRTTV